MPHFDATITLGAVMNVVILMGVGFGAWKAFASRVDEILRSQRELMDILTRRFEVHEEADRELFQSIQVRLLDLVGGVQRLVGQNDVFRQAERRDRK